MDFGSYADARSALERNETSCEALVSSFLDVIDEKNAELNAFLSVDREEALERARRLDAELADGHWRPLTGLVPETERAWHAGNSRHHGRPDVNSRSIGIELRNAGRLTPAGDGERYFTCTGRLYRPRNPVQLAEGHHWERFAEPQLEAVCRLCAEVAGRHGITADGLVSHSEVATPPGRKIDPGPLFPWDRLRRSLTQS